jgi:hypothetical protein
MKLNELLTTIAPTNAKISGREPSPDGDGWILYIGRLEELVYPFATVHCIPIHVPHLEDPELHEEEVNAVLRRFRPKGKKGPEKIRG